MEWMAAFEWNQWQASFGIRRRYWLKREPPTEMRPNAHDFVLVDWVNALGNGNELGLAVGAASEDGG